VRGQMGGMAGGGETIDGSWREADAPRPADIEPEPGTIIIDQRPDDER